MPSKKWKPPGFVERYLLVAAKPCDFAILTEAELMHGYHVKVEELELAPSKIVLAEEAPDEEYRLGYSLDWLFKERWFLFSN